MHQPNISLLTIQTLLLLSTTWDFYRAYKYVHVNLMLRRDWTETLLVINKYYNVSLSLLSTTFQLTVRILNKLNYLFDLCSLIAKEIEISFGNMASF